MKEVLNAPMQENDANAETIGEYLIKLLLTLWERGESFSGKRPFGNSGWEHDLYYALVKNNHIKGKIDDEYGDLIDYDRAEGDKIIFECIRSLYTEQTNNG